MTSTSWIWEVGWVWCHQQRQNTWEEERSWGREEKYQLSLRHEAIERPYVQPVVFGGGGLKVGRERVAWLLGVVSTETVTGALRVSRISKGWCMDEARTGPRTEPGPGLSPAQDWALPRELPSLSRARQLGSLRQLAERRKATGGGQRGVNGRRKVLWTGHLCPLKFTCWSPHLQFN